MMIKKLIYVLFVSCLMTGCINHQKADFSITNKEQIEKEITDLAALTIQEIPKCQLNDWSTAEAFFDLWKENKCPSKE